MSTHDNDREPDDETSGRPPEVGFDSRSEERRQYDVGYRKPPKSTRFKPGRSGNPKGGKKRRPSVAEQVEREWTRKVTVNVGGKLTRLTVQEVALRSVAASAAKGDLKAVRLLLELGDSEKNGRLADIDPAKLALDSQAVLADLLRQLQMGEPIAPAPVISAGSPPDVSTGNQEPLASPPHQLADCDGQADAPVGGQPAEHIEPSSSASGCTASEGASKTEVRGASLTVEARDPVGQTSGPLSDGSRPSEGSAPTPIKELPPAVSNWPYPPSLLAVPVPAGGGPSPSKTPAQLTLVNPPSAPAVITIRAAPMPPMTRDRDDEDA